MWDTALDAATLSLCAVLTALSLLQLRQLLALPPSRFSRLLLVLTATLNADLVCNAVWVYTPALHTAWGMMFANTPIFANMVVALLAELEFLKLLAPFLPGVSPRVIARVQVGAAVLGVVYIASAVQPFLPEAWWQPIEVFWLVYLLSLGVYDVAQHVYLLHFVVVRMRGATVEFKRRYVAVIATGFVILASGLVLAFVFDVSVVDPSGSMLLLTALLPAFELCALQSILQLRAALAAHARRAQVRMPRELRQDDADDSGDAADSGSSGGRPNSARPKGAMRWLGSWCWRADPGEAIPSASTGGGVSTASHSTSVGVGARVQPAPGGESISPLATAATGVDDVATLDAAHTLRSHTGRGSRLWPLWRLGGRRLSQGGGGSTTNPGSMFSGSGTAADDGATVLSGISLVRAGETPDNGSMELSLIESRDERASSSSSSSSSVPILL
ncbi:hypothetical protein HK105_208598 [Polyrhizophydium stewartii]|uniref:Uncharacterized protein n=1 Tax=Polyrhizophydium stewartii TaxID=2732419 RepID=A0ABR4MXE1_9FUNG